MMKKVLFFLATEKGNAVLKKLIESGWTVNIAGVVSFHEIDVKQDFFHEIESLCRDNSILFFEWRSIRENIKEIITNTNATGAVAISWKYLIPLDINDLLKDRLIVFHDSLLPKYRGFAPIPTAMICGDNNIGATVLFASEKADCGDIIDQCAFEISEDMYIEDVIKHMSEIYGDLAHRLMHNMIFGIIKSKKQDENNATYSVWRDEDDYWINWNDSSRNIHRFVRALGHPYKGAKTRVDNNDIRIIKAEIVEDRHFEIRDPGKIFEINDNKPVVICGDGLLRILEAYNDSSGEPYRFSHLRCRCGGGYFIKRI